MTLFLDLNAPDTVLESINYPVSFAIKLYVFKLYLFFVINLIFSLIRYSLLFVILFIYFGQEKFQVLHMLG